VFEYAQQQQAVAQAAFQDAGEDWSKVELDYVSQGGVSQLGLWKTGPAGRQLIVDFTADQAYESLREAMVDEHGAWISSTMELTPDGRYSFTFNYAQERAWPDGLPITREALEEDLREHPRPWAEIPDWHPVKQDHTEETWAAETKVD
jgi:hypothetical protein